MNYWIKAIILASLTTNLFAQEYLVRFKTHNEESKKLFLKRHGGTFELVSKEGNLYKWTSNTRNIPTWDASVGYISKNKKIPTEKDVDNAVNRLMKEKNIVRKKGVSTDKYLQ